MGTYISSKGEEKNTQDMATPYLLSALNKAIETGNEDNRKVLQEELDIREATETGESQDEIEVDGDE